jgi:hypothetical protein
MRTSWRQGAGIATQIRATKFHLALVLLISAASVAHSDEARIAELSESIGANVASKNWDAADADYEQLYSVYLEDFGAASRQAIAMSKVLGDWKIQAHRSGLLSESATSVIAGTSSFFTQLIEEIENQHGQLAEDLIDPLYGQAMVEYHLFQIATKKPVSSYRGVGLEFIQEERCVASEDGGAVVFCDYEEAPNRDYIVSQAQAKSNEVEAHWSAIAASLERIIEICELNQYLLDQAEAMIHLGDHFLYGGEGELAIEIYANAYQMLVRNTDGAEWVQRLFNTPTVVPSLTTSFPGANPAPILTHGMKIGFSIDENGKAQNVEIVGGADASTRAVRQNTTQIISGAIFRPGFDFDGVMESKYVEI